MPLAECPTCKYRSPVRKENLNAYNQCLRCTTRFIPAPAGSRLWTQILAAAVGAFAVSAGVAWAVLRLH